MFCKRVPHFWSMKVNVDSQFGFCYEFKKCFYGSIE